MEAYSQSLADLLPRQEAINERMKEMNNFSASGFWETLKSDFGDTMWRIFSIDGLVEQFKDFGVL
ncbi:MAG: hypothetical protein LBG52_06865 [Candidatus Peribacteria bacterium]|jgi:hypothetical protein|nr:hypothetical protein [Candidatus Peribacteria bacterium]